MDVAGGFSRSGRYRTRVSRNRHRACTVAFGFVGYDPGAADGAIIDTTVKLGPAKMAVYRRNE